MTSTEPVIATKALSKHYSQVTAVGRVDLTERTGATGWPRARPEVIAVIQALPDKTYPIVRDLW